MASNRIDVNVNGKDNTAAAFNSVSKNADKAANNINTLNKNIASTATEATKAGATVGSSISGGVNKAAASLNSLKGTSGSVGSAIGSSISKGASVASASISKLQSTASNAFNTIKVGASAASQSLGGMGNAVASLAGGFGAFESLSAMVGGAMTKQFTQAELAMKVGNERAKELAGTIGQIVAETPGDDTYMNQLLGGMIAKEQTLSNDQLRQAGFLASDYIIKSRAVGKTMLETQMDLKEYLLTGNTGQLERDSILKMQLDSMKGQGTVSERILALDKAMKAEGYEGLSQMDVMLIKWDTLKGKLQYAATTIGEKILPPLEKIVKFFLVLDDKTGGWSTILGVAVGTIGLIFIALGPVIASTLTAYYAMKNYRIEAEKAALANAANKGPPGATVNPGQMTPISTAPVGLGALTTVAGWQAIAAGATVTAGAVAAIGIAGGLALKSIDSLSQGLSHMLQKMVVPQSAKDIIDFVVTLPGRLTIGAEKVSGSWKALFQTGPIGAFVYLTQSLGNALGKVSQGLEVIKFLLGGGTFQTTQIDKTTQSVTATADSVNTLTDSWVNFVNWYTSGCKSITDAWNNTGKYITGAWSNTVAYITGAWNNTVSFVVGKWNQLKSAISGGISTTVNIIWTPIQRAIDKFWELYNTVRNNPIVQTVITRASSGASIVSNYVSDPVGSIGSAASSAWGWLTGARGPGDVQYQDYAGYTGKDAWQADGTLAGNCVDMSVGLVQRYGGSLVNGTWNGGLHTWWKAPNGQEYDPSRKALNNTWAPPTSRGPGNSSGQNIIIQGDVYGFDDFQSKVEQANDRIMRSTI